jgi:hypothetical protein
MKFEENGKKIEKVRTRSNSGSLQVMGMGTENPKRVARLVCIKYILDVRCQLVAQ